MRVVLFKEECTETATKSSESFETTLYNHKSVFSKKK